MPTHSSVNRVQSSFSRYFLPPIYRRRSVLAFYLGFFKFLTILFEMSPLQFLGMNIALPAFVFLNIMANFKGQINKANNALRETEASRLKKILINLALLIAGMGFTIGVVGFTTFIFGLASLNFCLFVTTFSFVKLIHHTRHYFKLLTYSTENDITPETLLAEKKYHRKNIVESLLTMGASLVLAFYPPASIAALSVTGAFVTYFIVRHAPAAIKIVRQIIDSIIYPDTKPWRDLDDENDHFAPLTLGFSSLMSNRALEFENTHSASELQEVNASVKDSIKRLKKRYSDVDIDTNLQDIEAYLKEELSKGHKHAKKALQCFKHIIILKTPRDTTCDFKNMLALIWEAAKDPKALPEEEEERDVASIERYIATRKSALMERLFESETAYLSNRSCYPGIYNRCVFSQNQAHPDVKTLFTKDALLSHVNEGIPVYLKEQFKTKTLFEQKQILKTWDNDGETEASAFRYSAKANYRRELNERYRALLTPNERSKVIENFKDLEKPTDHPLISLENNIKNLRTSGNKNRDAAIIKLQKATQKIYDNTETLNEIHNGLQERCTLLFKINNVELTALSQQIESLPNDNTCPKRQIAIEYLKQQASQASALASSLSWDAVKAYKPLKESLEKFEKYDQFAQQILSLKDEPNTPFQDTITMLKNYATDGYTRENGMASKRTDNYLPNQIKILLKTIENLTDSDKTRQAAIKKLQENIDHLTKTSAYKRDTLLNQYLALCRIYKPFESLDNLAKSLIARDETKQDHQPYSSFLSSSFWPTSRLATASDNSLKQKPSNISIGF